MSVGGDGTFNELMHALIDRTQEKAGISMNVTDMEILSPRLRIGIIPAGGNKGPGCWKERGSLEKGPQNAKPVKPKKAEEARLLVQRESNAKPTPQNL